MPARGGWVEVEWSSGMTNSYRMGAEGKYDLKMFSVSLTLDIPTIPLKLYPLSQDRRKSTGKRCYSKTARYRLDLGRTGLYRQYPRSGNIFVRHHYFVIFHKSTYSVSQPST